MEIGAAIKLRDAFDVNLFPFVMYVCREVETLFTFYFFAAKYRGNMAFGSEVERERIAVVRLRRYCSRCQRASLSS